MRRIKLLLVALVAMIGFGSCEKENSYDHSADLVGTWTCLTADYAEALVIKADGSAVSTGVAEGEYWENVAGNIAVKDGKITMTFEDGDNFEGHFDIIPGMAFSIQNQDGERLVYNFCKEDLSEEVVGMWVCNDGLKNMAILTFSENGKMTTTTEASEFVTTDLLNVVCNYKVVGDLVFKIIPKDNITEGYSSYIISRVVYTPNGTSLGDILIEHQYTPSENGIVELTSSFLRVKQNLNLAGKMYDYSDIFVSNVKGLDKDFEFMGYTMNFAKMDGSMLDKMFKNVLFNIEFPNANTLRYTYHYANGKQVFDAPIAVNGNKFTIKMSQKVPTLKDVDFYAFQDANDRQLHLYMHHTTFVNFYTNIQAMLMEAMDEQFDITNAEAVNAIYNSIDEAVESINLTLVMESATKAL